MQFRAVVRDYSSYGNIDCEAMDLLEYAAVQTGLLGGEVFPMDNCDRISARSPLVVQYRY